MLPFGCVVLFTYIMIKLKVFVLVNACNLFSLNIASNHHKDNLYHHGLYFEHLNRFNILYKKSQGEKVHIVTAKSSFSCLQ